MEACNMINDKNTLAQKYMDISTALNYPVYNHVLDKESDYIQNLYFKMLAVILEQGNDLTVSQRIFFERLIAGAESDYESIEFLRQALDLEIDNYVNFTDQCKNKDIKYRFILDALILSVLGNIDKEQSKLIASFADSLVINKEELKYLALLAKAVIEQDTTVYATAEENLTSSIPYNTLKDHIEPLVNGKVCKNNNLTIICNSDSIENSIKTANTPNIKLKNIKLSLKQHNIKFDDFKTVTLENCIFENDTQLDFLHCQAVHIKSCEFTNYTVTAIKSKEIYRINIEDTFFDNFDLIYHLAGSIEGEILHSLDEKFITRPNFTNCSFKDCYACDKFLAYSLKRDIESLSYLSNCQCDLYHCSFDSCFFYKPAPQKIAEKKSSYKLDRKSVV